MQASDSRETELQLLKRTADRRVLQLQEDSNTTSTAPKFSDAYYWQTVLAYGLMMAFGQVVEHYFQAEDWIVYYTGLPQTNAVPTLVFLSSFCLLFWLDFHIQRTETWHTFPPPDGYAGSPTIREKERPLVDNARILRQDVRDKYPVFCVSLAIASQKHPLTASLAGFFWVFGCFHFAHHGYSTKAEMNLPYRQRRSIWCFISMAVLHSIMTAHVLSEFYKVN